MNSIVSLNCRTQTVASALNSRHSFARISFTPRFRARRRPPSLYSSTAVSATLSPVSCVSAEYVRILSSCSLCVVYRDERCSVFGAHKRRTHCVTALRTQTPVAAAASRDNQRQRVRYACLSCRRRRRRRLLPNSV